MLDADRRTMMKLAVAGTSAALAGPALGRKRKGSGSPADFDHLTVRHRTVNVEGFDIFYREAGRPNAPAVLLLHG